MKAINTITVKSILPRFLINMIPHLKVKCINSHKSEKPFYCKFSFYTYVLGRDLWLSSYKVDSASILHQLHSLHQTILKASVSTSRHIKPITLHISGFPKSPCHLVSIPRLVFPSFKTQPNPPLLLPPNFSLNEPPLFPV